MLVWSEELMRWWWWWWGKDLDWLYWIGIVGVVLWISGWRVIVLFYVRFGVFGFWFWMLGLVVGIKKCVIL